MKTRILIIEDNYYRYFTAKQVIEAKTKISVNVETASDFRSLQDTAAQMKPDLLMFRPTGGILELVEFLKKKNVNCRNSEISMVLIPMSCVEEGFDLHQLGQPGKTRLAHAA